MEITLPSGRKIGDGQPVFIIAEVGSNWRTLDDCLSSIRCAKAAGADAVKFQLFDIHSLYGWRTYKCTPPCPDQTDHVHGNLLSPALEEELSKKLPHAPGLAPYLDRKWLPHLKRECDKVGIEFMCSAFSPELLREVDKHVNIHKIASAELTHVRLLEAARECGKPVILSTGASGEADIAKALEVLTLHPTSQEYRQLYGGSPVVLMYCVAAYPAREMNLALLPVLRDRFGCLVGYSDHSLDARTIPQASVGHGACVLEKHAQFVEGEHPDSPHSLDRDQFAAMVRHLRGDAIDHLGPTPEERDMILRHNRRLIATQNIAPGVALQEGVNFGVFRSLVDESKALSPWLINRVNGKVAASALKAGEGIGPNDVRDL